MDRTFNLYMQDGSSTPALHAGFQWHAENFQRDHPSKKCVLRYTLDSNTDVIEIDIDPTNGQDGANDPWRVARNSISGDAYPAKKDVTAMVWMYCDDNASVDVSVDAMYVYVEGAQ